MVGGSSRRSLSRVLSGAEEIVLERVAWLSRSERVVNGWASPDCPCGLRELRKLRTASCGSTALVWDVVEPAAALLHKVSPP